MLDSDGTTQYERQNIADIFATFHEQLYNGTKRNKQNNLTETKTPPTTINYNFMSEFDEALKYLKTRRHQTPAV